MTFSVGWVVIRDSLIYSGIVWHSVDFVRLLGKNNSGLYVLKVGEEHIGNLVDRSGLYV